MEQICSFLASPPYDVMHWRKGLVVGYDNVSPATADGLQMVQVCELLVEDNFSSGFSTRSGSVSSF